MDHEGPTLSERVRAFAEKHPERLALIEGERRLSYGLLDAFVDHLGTRLSKAGVRAGDLIGLGLPRTIERIAFTLAAWRLGAAVALLDPAWPAQRFAAVVADAGVRLTVLDEGYGGEALSSTEILHYPVGQPLSPRGDGVAPVSVGFEPDALAYIVYTSGSTGSPKGVKISHANLAALIAWHNEAFAVSAESRATHLAGVAFDAAMWEVFPYLAAGASVHLAPETARTDPDRLQQWLLATGATHAFAPTILAEALLDRSWPDNALLRFLLTGGDRLRRYPLAGLPFQLVNNYGPSECTVVTTSGIVSPDPTATRPPSIGVPVLGATVHLLDPTGHPVASGELGEICIGGALVGQGYHRRPEEDQRRFIPDPSKPGARLYRSGDLARQRPDGSLDFAGRLDDQLKVRGQRVEPDEVAAHLLRHSQIAAAAVTGVDGEGGTVLAAYTVAAAGSDGPPPETLRAYLLERLPDWAVPAFFVALNALPLTANGKLDRAALPDPRAATPQGDAASPAEERLLAILRTVLGDQPVGVDDNFFLLGGHSLLGTQVVLRASDAFGVELTLAHLFSAPTVRMLAAVVEELVLEAVAAMSDEELLRAHG